MRARDQKQIKRKKETTKRWKEEVYNLVRKESEQKKYVLQGIIEQFRFREATHSFINLPIMHMCL